MVVDSIHRSTTPVSYISARDTQTPCSAAPWRQQSQCRIRDVTRKNSSSSRTLFVSGGWKSRQEYNIFICPLSFQCVFICVIECIGFWVSTSCPLILRWKNIFGPPLSIWAQVRLFIHCFCQFAHFLSTSLRYFLKQGQKCFLISLKIFSSASA